MSVIREGLVTENGQMNMIWYDKVLELHNFLEIILIWKPVKRQKNINTQLYMHGPTLFQQGFLYCH